MHPQAELQQLFAAEGFCCDAIKVHQRFTCNRALQTTMERHWVQATFTYQGPGEGHPWVQRRRSRIRGATKQCHPWVQPAQV